jgi:hypothetical protein
VGRRIMRPHSRWHFLGVWFSVLAVAGYFIGAVELVQFVYRAHEVAGVALGCVAASIPAALYIEAVW